MAKPNEARRKQPGGVGANVWTSHLLRLDSMEADVLRALDTTTDTIAAIAERAGVNVHSLSHWVSERRGPSHLKQRAARVQSERYRSRRRAREEPAAPPPLAIEDAVRKLRRAERTWSYVVHALRIDLDQIAAARAAYYDEGHQMGGQRGAA